MTDYDAALRAVCAEPRDRKRWLVLCDHLEEDGYALGARLRHTLLSWDVWRAEGFVHPAAQASALPRILAAVTLADRAFGPKAGVLRGELAAAGRLGRALRGVG